MKKLFYFLFVLSFDLSIAQIPGNFDFSDHPISTDPNLLIGEVSVFLNMWNPSIVACGSNANNNNSGVFGQALFFSEDGGSSWSKVDASSPIHGLLVTGSAGDPAGVIDHNGHLYFTYLNGSINTIESDYKTQNPPYKSFTNPLPLSGSNVDKDHLEIDDRPIADHIALYSGWSSTGGSWNIEVRSADVISQVTNWNPIASITAGMSLPPGVPYFKYHTGINIAVGPDGDAYAAWGLYYNGGIATEKYIGFAKTSDKWNSWPSNGASFYIPNLVIKGIRGNLSVTNCSSVTCASWMTMAINQQNGDIYIAWPNMGIPCDDNSLPSGCNTSNKADIYIIRSSDKGTTWSAPQLAYSTTAISYNHSHWNSWLACDPFTGYLGVIYYGKDASGNTVTYLSLSKDAGVNWTEQQISDHVFNNTIANAPPTDYISLKMSNGWVVPVWTGIDPLTGLQTAITQPFAMDVPAIVSLCGTGTPFYETIKAQNSVSLSTSACGYNIPLGSYINTYAADHIKFSDGFHASAGSKFHAHIEATPDPFNSHQRNNTKEIKAEIIKSDLNINLFPNPFQGRIEIKLTSDFDTHITLEIYDNTGRLVKQLLRNTAMNKGTSVFILNRAEVAITGGVYNCVVTTSTVRKSAKLVCID